MSAAWFLAEAGADGEPTRATTELASVARSLAAGSPTTAIVFGADAAAAARIAETSGAQALVIDAGADADATTRGRALAAVLAAASARDEQPAVILVPTSPESGDIAGTLQALADLPALANAETVELGEDGSVSIGATVFGDRLRVRQTARPGTAIVLARPGVTASASASALAREAGAPQAGEAASVEVVHAAVEASHVRVIDRRPVATAALEQARIIVTAGRGVGGPDGIALVADLADCLGAALGASRAAVDQGWIDYAHQVGQTGRRVSPDVYLALGVSGAAAHAAGMRRSRTVIAVNRDPEAPMADLADLYVVGDLFEIVPRLAAAVRARA